MQHRLTQEFPVIRAVPAAGEREADARVADAGDQHLIAAKLNGDALADIQQHPCRLSLESLPGLFDQKSQTGAIHRGPDCLEVRFRVGGGGNQ